MYDVLCKVLKEIKPRHQQGKRRGYRGQVDGMHMISQENPAEATVRICLINQQVDKHSSRKHIKKHQISRQTKAEQICLIAPNYLRFNTLLRARLIMLRAAKRLAIQFQLGQVVGRASHAEQKLLWSKFYFFSIKFFYAFNLY